MDATNLLQITGTILGKQFLFESDCKKLIASLGEPSLALESISIPEVYTERLLAFYQQQEKTAIGLRKKEASGIPLLGAFLACVVDILNGQKQVSIYRYELEFTVMKVSGTPGKNPATDGAVVAAVQVSSPPNIQLQPVIIYEYKPVVDPQIKVVDTKDLTELLIQGFYCFHLFEIDKCLLCLTDLYRFHYMKVTKPASRMAIEWAKSISFKQKQIQEHLSFIAAAIS